jgi:hypothetical protein
MAETFLITENGDFLIAENSVSFLITEPSTTDPEPMVALSKQEPDVINANYAGYVLNFNSAGDSGATTRVDRSGVLCLAGFNSVYMIASANIAPSLGADSKLDINDIQLRVPFLYYSGAALKAGVQDFDTAASGELLLRSSLAANETTNPVEILNNRVVVPNMAGAENVGHIAGPLPPFMYIKLGTDMLPDQGSSAAITGTIHIWASK